jgi:hypothetical protein
MTNYKNTSILFKVKWKRIILYKSDFVWLH